MSRPQKEDRNILILTPVGLGRMNIVLLFSLKASSVKQEIA